MKGKLLNEIDFNVVETVNDMQMAEIAGGGLAEIIGEIIKGLFNMSQCL